MFGVKFYRIKVRVITAELIFGVKFYRIKDSCHNSRVDVWCQVL